MSRAIIEIYTDNGKLLKYTHGNPDGWSEIADALRSPRLFSQKTLILASSVNVANIQTASIELIRFRTTGDAELPPDESQPDIVEISKEAFEKEYGSLTEEEKLAPRFANPGDFMTSYLEILTEGGQEVYVRLHVEKKSTQEGRMFFAHLFDRPTMEFRLENGGFGIIRPSKVTSQVTFPGPGPDVLPGTALVVD